MNPPAPSGRFARIACATMFLSGCAQGSLAVSSSDIMNTVVLAGTVLSRAGSGGSSSDSRGAATGASRARIPASPKASAAAARVLSTADEYVGTRYVWGGNTPSSGFDCSGFTKYVFARQGVTLPRTAREQARVGQNVGLDASEWLPGDIITFAEPGEAVSHVAIYVGDGEIIHASSAMGGVNYLDLNSGRGDWYVMNAVAVRRVTR